jgi:hypothetical protein
VCKSNFQVSIFLFATNSVVILVDGQERGRGTAARKHVASDIAADVALASLREEDP